MAARCPTLTYLRVTLGDTHLGWLRDGCEFCGDAQAWSRSVVHGLSETGPSIGLADAEIGVFY